MMSHRQHAPDVDRSTFRLLPLVIALAMGLAACGGQADDDPIQLHGPDTGTTADATGDTGTEEPPPLADLPECRSSTPASATEPTSLDVGPWLLATAPSSGNLGSVLDKGEFQMPDAQANAYGTTWYETSLNDQGVIDLSPTRGAQLYYAAAQISVDEPTTYFARADGIYNIYVGQHRQPGDVYGYSDKRVPIPLDAGQNTVVLEFSPQRAHAIELFSSPDDIYFNTADITAPHLRVGQQTAQPVGVQVVNLTEWPLRDVTATVVENEHFQQTSNTYPALGPHAVNQLSWRLDPKSDWQSADQTIEATLRFDACALETAYETTIELQTVGAGENFKRTFRSPIDGSTQYYSVVPPVDESSAESYGLVLTLHGAGVDATGQADAYTRKEWAYIVAPTNRRKFGFNWEAWGHHNGMNAIRDAMDRFSIDQTNVHVTGHSMGGHGTWHFGVMHPGTFATVNPSAGWGSIYTYPPGGESQRPDEPVQSARAHSETRKWLPNLSDRAAYIVHGGQDENVPTSEGVDMRDQLRQYCDNVQWHEESGAEHWWDREDTPGTDCVDWPPMFDLMQMRSVDPVELNFEFITPGPYYSGEHAYATIQSRSDPLDQAKLVSETTSDTTLRLTTTNVRSMTLDGAGLTDKGITEIAIGSTEQTDDNGNVTYETRSVTDDVIEIGPQTGKRLGRTGPINQAFQTPFCFVYPERPSGAFRSYVSNLQSIWSVRGNGHSCALPANYVDAELREDYTLIFVGTDFDALNAPDNLPFSWNGDSVSLGESNSFANVVAWLTYPTPEEHGKGVAVAITAPDDRAWLLNRYDPFNSRSGMPDYLIYGESGGQALGFFGPEWTVRPDFGAGVQ